MYVGLKQPRGTGALCDSDPSGCEGDYFSGHSSGKFPGATGRLKR